MQCIKRNESGKIVVAIYTRTEKVRKSGNFVAIQRTGPPQVLQKFINGVHPDRVQVHSFH